MRILQSIILAVCIVFAFPLLAAEEKNESEVLRLKKALIQTQMENLLLKYRQLRESLNELNKRESKKKESPDDEKFKKQFPDKLH